MSYTNEVRTTPKAQFNTNIGGLTRVGQATTLGDLKCLNADYPLLIENVGTGTGTFANNVYTMSVTSGQYRIRRSRQYFPYFSGKVQLIELTFDNFHIEANTTKRVGYFSSNAVAPYDSDKDGVWIEDNGIDKYLVISNFGSEVLRLHINAWSGYSNISSYNWQNFTVMAIDYLWLGGAALRVSLKTDQGFVEAHTYHYAGTSQGIFMKSPNQNTRYEIRSTTGSGTFRPICSQVSTEGSIKESGKQRSVDTGSTAITLTTAGTNYPILAIRKQTGYRDASLKAVGFDAFVSTNADITRVQLVLNPTFSAPLTYTQLSNSAVEYGVGNGTITVTGGTVLQSITITQNSIIPTGLLDEDYLSVLGNSIDNTSDILCLVGTPTTGTSNTGIFGSISFKEY